MDKHSGPIKIESYFGEWIQVDNVVFERHAVSLIDVVDDKDHCSMLIMDGADFIHYDANRPPSEVCIVLTLIINCRLLR